MSAAALRSIGSLKVVASDNTKSHRKSGGIYLSDKGGKFMEVCAVFPKTTKCKCPICGTEFVIKNNKWGYTIKGKRRQKPIYYCSYPCLRKAETPVLAEQQRHLRAITPQYLERPSHHH